MSRSYKLLTIVVLAAMVLAACGATPTVTPVPPTIAVAAAAPQIAPTALPTAAPAAAVAATATTAAPAAAATTAATKVPAPTVAVAPTELKVAFRASWVEGFNYFVGALWNAQGDIMPYFYMPLAFVNSSGEFVPWLAKSWEIAKDCSSITIKLYPDAKWTDGIPVTAADVKFFLDAMSWPEVSKWNLGIKGSADVNDGKTRSLTGVVILDDQTVRLDWETGTFKCFIGQTALSDIMPVPKHIFEKYPPADLVKGTYPEAKDPTVTNGPFKLGKYEKNVYFEALPVANWWGEKYYGKAKVSKIIAVTALTGGAQQALISGQVDVAQGACAAADCDKFAAANPNIQVLARESLMMFGYQFNMKQGLKLPDKIRQAIDYATDRKALNQQFNAGKGSIQYSFMSNEGPYKADDLVWRAYNVDKAKSLIQEAIKDGSWTAARVVKIINGDAALQNATLTLWAEQLRAAGLNAQFTLVGLLGTDMQIKGDYDITMAWGGQVRGQPEAVCPYFLLPSGMWFNQIGWYDQSFVDACNKGLATTDQAQLKTIFGQLTKYYYDNGPWMEFLSPVVFWGARKGVCGVDPSGGHPLISRGGKQYGLFDWSWCGS